MKNKYIWCLLFTMGWLAGCRKKDVLNPVVTPGVVTVNPINVTSTSAQLQGISLTGGGNITNRGFYWTIESPAMFDAKGQLDMTMVDSLIIHTGTKVDVPNTGDFSAMIGGLTKDTVYFVKAFAGNVKGNTSGQSVLFRSSTLVPPTVQITQGFTGMGDSAAIVNGQVVAVGGSVVTERGFIWGTSPIPDSDAHKIILGAGQGNMTDTILSLQRFVKYYVFTYAVNSYGTTYSQPLIVLFVPPTFTDSRDGQVYSVVQYGGTIWMTQNFRYIPAVGDAAGIWVQGYTGASVQEAAATDAYQTYGCLYDLQHAIDLAPAGWHLATDDDWNTLEIVCSNGALDTSTVQATGWIETVNSGRLKAWGGAANDLQFNLLPGGNQWCGGGFQDFTVWAHYWAAEATFSYSSSYRRMLAGWDNGIYRLNTAVDGFPTCAGLSVRYVKND